jgi:hypothetical protein
VVRADLGPAPGVAVAEVDTGLITTVRASLPSLANRRDDVFGPPAPVSSPLSRRGCPSHVAGDAPANNPSTHRRSALLSELAAYALLLDGSWDDVDVASMSLSAPA